MLRNVLMWLFAFVLVVHLLADWLHLFEARGKRYFVVLLDVIIDATLLFGFIYLMGGVQF
jgi:hypothetical protein